MRIEKDFLGDVELADDFPFGIHTHRACENFGFSDDRLRKDIFQALIQVKKAAALANGKAGLLEEELSKKLVRACDDILERIDSLIPPIHPFQGGAGTSTNMAANELIANIALKNSGLSYGSYNSISPLDHVNLSQSTNDTYPTAVKIAIIKGLKTLHNRVEDFLNQLLLKEKEFAHILKVGRTQLQDAMPLSLGQEFSAWAETMTRFRWRLSKALDWVREVNLSGTAVGTGINADHNYSLHVMDELRAIVQEPLALSRNLIDGTQNIDQLVEVSGLIKTGAAALKKIAADIRLLSSGPKCGFGELRLPAVQAGSSIMPGKVNPVMLEAAEQICIHVMGGDAMITTAASQGNLELPQFLPYIAHLMTANIELFGNMLAKLTPTIAGISADTQRINTHINSAFSVATLLTPVLGYDKAAALVKKAENEQIGIIDLIKRDKLIDPVYLAELLTPQVMASPGLPLPDKQQSQNQQDEPQQKGKSENE